MELLGAQSRNICGHARFLGDRIYMLLEITLLGGKASLDALKNAKEKTFNLTLIPL